MIKSNLPAVVPFSLELRTPGTMTRGNNKSFRASSLEELCTYTSTNPEVKKGVGFTRWTILCQTHATLRQSSAMYLSEPLRSRLSIPHPNTLCRRKQNVFIPDEQYHGLKYTLNNLATQERTSDGLGLRGPIIQECFLPKNGIPPS